MVMPLYTFGIKTEKMEDITFLKFDHFKRTLEVTN